MIEAVENHMPETIIIDEIGTELEALAASTIAQRGAQLVGTAHGMTTDNIIKNSSLQILVGGIESVTLGDDTAQGTHYLFMKLGSKPDTFRSDGNNVRYVPSDLATDIAVTVGDIKFYLHKFPLLSKSVRLQKLVGSGIEENCNEVQISDIPGGPVAFEICAKFCYGMIVNLNAHNVVATRCATKYLGQCQQAELLVEQ